MANEEQDQSTSSAQSQSTQENPPPATSQNVEPELPPITVTKNPVMIQNSADRKPVREINESNKGNQDQSEE